MSNIIAAELTSIISLFALGSAQNSVAFFDQSNPGSQIFINAKPLNVELEETIRTMLHPVESGQLVGDFKIIEPMQLEIPVMIQADFYAATYQEIKQFYLNSTLIGVALRTGYYQNFIVSKMPHKETADQFDVVVMNLHLTEVLFVPTPPPYSPALPSTPSTATGGGIPGVTQGVSDNEANNFQSVVPVGQVEASTWSGSTGSFGNGATGGW